MVVVRDALPTWLSAFPRRSAQRYTQVLAGVWEVVQLVEVRLCLTSIVGAFPIPAGITSFACPHILVYNDERRSVVIYCVLLYCAVTPIWIYSKPMASIR